MVYISPLPKSKKVVVPPTRQRSSLGRSQSKAQELGASVSTPSRLRTNTTAERQPNVVNEGGGKLCSSVRQLSPKQQDPARNRAGALSNSTRRRPSHMSEQPKIATEEAAVTVSNASVPDFKIDSYLLASHLNENSRDASHHRPPVSRYQVIPQARKQERKSFVDKILKAIGNSDVWSCVPIKHRPDPIKDPLDCSSEYLYNILICVFLTQIQEKIEEFEELSAGLEVVVVPRRAGSPGGKQDGIVYLSYQLEDYADLTRARRAEMKGRDEHRY